MNRSTFIGVMMPLGGTKQVQRYFSMCLIAGNRNSFTVHFILHDFHPIYMLS